MTIDELIRTVKEQRDTRTLAVACPYDPVTLKAARNAFEEDIARSFLFGNQARIEKTADENKISLKGFEISDIPGDHEAVAAAVDAAVKRNAHMLMKGDVTTRIFMSTVFHSKKGIVSPGNILSHIGLFYSEKYGRTMLLTDAGINISPSLERKMKIISNSIEVAHKIDIARPKIALLAAIEKVNIAQMPITIEAELMEKMGKAGMFGDAVVEGPFALDNAVDPEAALTKHVEGEVAGKADILVAPDIEAGNILYKSMVSFADIVFANVVVGGRVPLVLPSRSDCEKTKLASIAFASYLGE